MGGWYCSTRSARSASLIARVTLGQVGIVLSSEVTRLSRNCTDWYPLLDLCGYRQCLIGDRDGVYDPASVPLYGSICQVAIYDYALTPTQIYTHYNARSL